MKIVPNYFKIAITLLVFMAIFVYASVYATKLKTNSWWSDDYWFSLLIPLILAPTVLFFFFIPQWIIVNEEEFMIKQLLRSPRSIRYDQIKAYCYRNLIFMIQPVTGLALQIIYGAFSRNIWKSFSETIETKCPDKKVNILDWSFPIDK